MTPAERAHYIALLRAGTTDADWIVALLNAEARASAMAVAVAALARQDAFIRSIAEGK